MVSLSMTLSDPTRILTASRGFVSDSWAFLFVSPLLLRAPSTDRPETLPHGQNLAEFYNPTPKIPGALPQKIWGQKQAKFRSILDHFRL